MKVARQEPQTEHRVCLPQSTRPSTPALCNDSARRTPEWTFTKREGPPVDEKEEAAVMVSTAVRKWDEKEASQQKLCE